MDEMILLEEPLVLCALQSVKPSFQLTGYHLLHYLTILLSTNIRLAYFADSNLRYLVIPSLRVLSTLQHFPHIVARLSDLWIFLLPMYLFCFIPRSFEHLTLMWRILKPPALFTIVVGLRLVLLLSNTVKPLWRNSDRDEGLLRGVLGVVSLNPWHQPTLSYPTELLGVD